MMMIIIIIIIMIYDYAQLLTHHDSIISQVGHELDLSFLSHSFIL